MLEIGPIGENNEPNEIKKTKLIVISIKSSGTIKIFTSIDWGMHPGFARLTYKNGDYIYWNASDILSIQYLDCVKVTYFNSKVVKYFKIYEGEEVIKVSHSTQNQNREIC